MATNDCDPKVHILQVETIASFKKFERTCAAYVLGITGTPEERAARRAAAGPLIYKNLLALNNSVSLFVEQRSPEEYAAEDGWKLLLKELKQARFSEGKLAELPRVYHKFYRETVFRRGGAEPMQKYIAEREVAKAELEAADKDCKISNGEMAYWMLEGSGLTKDEKRYVLGHSRRGLRCAEDRPVAREPLPERQ